MSRYRSGPKPLFRYPRLTRRHLALKLVGERVELVHDATRGNPVDGETHERTFAGTLVAVAQPAVGTVSDQAVLAMDDGSFWTFSLASVMAIRPSRTPGPSVRPWRPIIQALLDAWRDYTGDDGMEIDVDPEDDPLDKVVEYLTEACEKAGVSLDSPEGAETLVDRARQEAASTSAAGAEELGP